MIFPSCVFGCLEPGGRNIAFLGKKARMSLNGKRTTKPPQGGKATGYPWTWSGLEFELVNRASVRQLK